MLTPIPSILQVHDIKAVRSVRSRSDIVVTSISYMRKSVDRFSLLQEEKRSRPVSFQGSFTLRV